MGLTYTYQALKPLYVSTNRRLKYRLNFVSIIFNNFLNLTIYDDSNVTQMYKIGIFTNPTH